MNKTNLDPGLRRGDTKKVLSPDHVNNNNNIDHLSSRRRPGTRQSIPNFNNKKISSVLIANRGEVALRIQSSCKACGMHTVAIYAPEDSALAFVAGANQAFPLSGTGGSAYLAQDEIISLALRSGADAIHPGYGFLSENADFAQKVIDAGLVWIGPSPECIRLMGNKERARTQAIDLGVPVVPGVACPTNGQGAYDTALASAHAIGFPVILKDPNSGGGKGIRSAHDQRQFARAWLRATSESATQTTSHQIVIEKYLEYSRHIEVQIAGDGKNVIHLFDRDCSTQRRNQKIIEEAPAWLDTLPSSVVPGKTGIQAFHLNFEVLDDCLDPGSVSGMTSDAWITQEKARMDNYSPSIDKESPSMENDSPFNVAQDTLMSSSRTRGSRLSSRSSQFSIGSSLLEAAVTLAKASAYNNIGTVEFLVTPDNNFYFLEMNTRLQVEHSVTESITGVDLVAVQLFIAQHGHLPFDQDAVTQRGHALECRIYAENPAHSFMPSTGVIDYLAIPNHPFVRIDHDLAVGQIIGSGFDPMIAKITAWGMDRAQATARMRECLDNFILSGVITNQQLLIAILTSNIFSSGGMHTQLLADQTYRATIPEQIDEKQETSINAAVIACMIEALPKPGRNEAPAHFSTNRWRDKQWK